MLTRNFAVSLRSYLHHFYFADSSVDTAMDLAETDSDTMKGVVEIVRREKLVVVLAD